MNKDLVEINHHQTFESLRQEEDGCQFWSARKLAKALEYNEYRNFLNVIEKAKEACVNSRHDIVDHFVDVTDMIDIGKGGQRRTADVRLFRYACYLVVQNGDPTKSVDSVLILPDNGHRLPKDQLIPKGSFVVRYS